jgi:hypothetical protein
MPYPSFPVVQKVRVRPTWSTRFGHGVRRDASILGAAVNGCNSGPFGLKKRLPSKWSLFRVTALYHQRRNKNVTLGCSPERHVTDDLDGDRERAPL